MEVESREGRGRCGVASRDLIAGELILKETAALYWHLGANELVDLVQVYKDASDTEKARIDDLTAEISSSTQALDELIGSWTEVLRDADERTGLLAGREVSDYLPLLLRAHFNAHAVEDGVCLFPMAAMFNGSCSPNAFYRCEGHTIKFFASRPIPRGEEITASYLESIAMLKPTLYRQQILLLGKGFLCRCERCSASGKDNTRAVRCLKVSCNGLLQPDNVGLIAETELTATTVWQCTDCGIELDEESAAAIESTETQLYDKWLYHDNMLSNGQKIDPEDINEAVKNANKSLSPEHFITQFERILAIEIGSTKPNAVQRLQLVAHAYTYANWLFVTFHTSVPFNLLGTMTGALAELFDRREYTIVHGLDIDRVLLIMRTVLPYARSRYGNEAAYVTALERVLNKYSTCAAAICDNKGKLARCGRCNSVGYCSRSCQIFHYKSGGHKAACLSIVEAKLQMPV